MQTSCSPNVQFTKFKKMCTFVLGEGGGGGDVTVTLLNGLQP